MRGLDAVTATHCGCFIGRGRARDPDEFVACQGDGQRPAAVYLWREGERGVWELRQPRWTPLSLWRVCMGFVSLDCACACIFPHDLDG